MVYRERDCRTGALLLEEGEVVLVEVLVLLLGSLEGLGLAAWGLLAGINSADMERVTYLLCWHHPF